MLESTPMSLRRWAPCLLAAALSACSLRTVAVRQTAEIADAGMPALLKEADPQLAREAMPGQLKLLETFLESDPANPRLLHRLAQGFAGYAHLFIEDEDPGRAAALYRRALSFALRLAERNPSLKGLDRLDPSALEGALRKAGPADAAALYWAATAWAGWADNAKGDPEALAGVPKAARLMGRVLELDPALEHGGPELWFGVYYCVRPRLAGGDPAKGRAYFEAALARSGGRYLTAKLFYAKYYAVAALDRALFARLLGEVSASDPLPDARLADEVARRKAKRLLERTDELF